jgi:hypothetical protein
MGPVTAALTLVALVGAGLWFQHRLAKGREWSPLWLAFSSTFAAALCLISGSMGFRLDRRASFLAGSRWSDTVVWSEIAIGVAFAALAVFYWRRAIREADRILNRA